MDNLLLRYIYEANKIRNTSPYRIISILILNIRIRLILKKIEQLPFFLLSMQFFQVMQNMYINMHITKYNDITIYQDSLKIVLDDDSYLVYYRSKHSYTYLVYGRVTFEIDYKEKIPKKAMVEWKNIKKILRKKYIDYVKDLSAMGVM